MPPLPPERILRRRLDIGQRIREVRLWRNLSQEDLGERAGSDLKTVSRLENGITSPSVDRLLDIADALDVPAISLMPGGPRPWER